MSTRMTAKQLLDLAEECADCGKKHRPVKIGPSQVTWANNGHPYRTRLYVLTGQPHGVTIAALRQLAGLP
jgi:hypothetical protein